MPVIIKLGRPMCAIAAVGLVLAVAAHAEDAYENMTGGMLSQFRSTPSVVLSYGENPAAFPPRPATGARVSVTAGSSSSGSNSYCVRTCDGRYFPAPPENRQNSAEQCKNLCPASETKVFFGSSIDNASSNGKSYAALPNAFRYRKELVAGCTCNGKDMIGLAAVKIEDDKTLRRGDMVATQAGIEVVNRLGEGRPGFANAPESIRGRFGRVPVLASD